MGIETADQPANAGDTQNPSSNGSDAEKTLPQSKVNEIVAKEKAQLARSYEEKLKAAEATAAELAELRAEKQKADEAKLSAAERATREQQRRDGVTTLPSGVNRYALGDQYTLVTTDLLTQVSRREPQKVTLATDTRVEINDGASVYNQLGGLLRDNSGDKDPPLLLVPTDIAPGKKWISAFQNSVAGFNIQGAVDFRTVAFEDVTIQGETMKAYRVTMEGLLGRLMLTGTVWIEPKSMRMVRWDRVLRAGPTVLEAARIEVTEYRAASRS